MYIVYMYKYTFILAYSGVRLLAGYCGISAKTNASFWNLFQNNLCYIFVQQRE